MLQELFRIPGLDWPVYGYGLMLVLGVYAAIELGRYLANRVGLNGDYFVTMGLLALAAGVLGARLSHVLENLEFYTRDDRTFWQNLRAAADLSSGGLTFYGGFLLAAPVVALYIWRRKIPIRVAMDIVAPCLMIGLALGRVGCLLNGCCWGQTCDLPWAVTFPYGSPPHEAHFDDHLLAVPAPLVEPVFTADGELDYALRDRDDLKGDSALLELARRSRSLPVHPAQVYSSLNALLIAGICLAYFTLRHSAGQVFALMLIIYSVGRFTLETLRVEPVVKFMGLDFGFSYSMWVAVFTFITGIVLWLVFQRFYRPMPVAASSSEAAVPALA
jgi:phosphatidylglycerol:prolipoprotein diacylglycerol transferase